MIFARVLKLVDSQDLKSCEGNLVWVRFPPRAQNKINLCGIFYFVVGYGIELRTPVLENRNVRNPTACRQSFSGGARFLKRGSGVSGLRARRPTPGTIK